MLKTWRNIGAAAGDPNDWSPTGAPQRGDDLWIYSSTTTMNIRGNDLAGDPLGMSGAHLTANLSNHASVRAVMYLFNTATFNLTGNSTLDLTTRSGWHVGENPVNVNMSGTNNFTLHSSNSAVTVNVSGRMNGTVDLGEYFGVSMPATTVNGGTWNNNGHSVIYNTENLVVGSDVVGAGSFDVTNTGGRIGQFISTPQPGSVARLEFIGSVGSHQVVTDSGLLVIDHPSTFDARVVLSVRDGGTMSNPVAASEIDLKGLANAASYSFRNDMLRLYDVRDRVIERLDLTDRTPHGFAVSRSGDVVSVVAKLDTTAQDGLPLHA